MAEQEPDNQDSLRAQLITKIWGCAVGMLGLSIPLSAIVGHAGNGGGFAAVVIPLSVVGGAALSTVAIWNPFAARSKQAPSKSQEAERVAELEERVASLEMILSYEEKLLESKMRQQPTMSQQPMLNQQPISSESSLPVANDFALSSTSEASPKPHRRSTKTSSTKAKREVA